MTATMERKQPKKIKLIHQRRTPHLRKIESASVCSALQASETLNFQPSSKPQDPQRRLYTARLKQETKKTGKKNRYGFWQPNSSMRPLGDPNSVSSTSVCQSEAQWRRSRVAGGLRIAGSQGEDRSARQAFPANTFFMFRTPYSVSSHRYCTAAVIE